MKTKDSTRIFIQQIKFARTLERLLLFQPKSRDYILEKKSGTRTAFHLSCILVTLPAAMRNKRHAEHWNIFRKELRRQRISRAQA